MIQTDEQVHGLCAGPAALLTRSGRKRPYGRAGRTALQQVCARAEARQEPCTPVTGRGPRAMRPRCKPLHPWQNRRGAAELHMLLERRTEPRYRERHAWSRHCGHATFRMRPSCDDRPMTIR